MACHVLAWLGHETKSSHEAISLLKQISDGSVPTANCDRPQFKGKWVAVKQLSEMPYWKRLWIIQELALSTQITFCCGHDILSGDAFLTFQKFLAAYLKYPSWNPNTSQEFPQMLPLRLFGTSKAHSAFATHSCPTNFEFKGAMCKDPRDKIFGLCGLARPCCEKLVVLDYSMTAFEICQDAISHYLQSHFLFIYEFAQSAMLVDTVHHVCDEGPSLTTTRAVLGAGVAPAPFKRLMGTIIYTTPLETIKLESENTISLRVETFLYEELLYLWSASNYFGYPPLDQALDIGSIILIKGQDWQSRWLEGPLFSHKSQHLKSFEDRLKAWIKVERSPWTWCGLILGKAELRNGNVIEDAFVEEDRFRKSDILGTKELADSWSQLVAQDLLDSYIRKLVDIARKDPHRYLPESQIKLFVDSNGMVGLTTKDTLAGDIIWEDDSPDSIAIARKRAAGYRVTAWSSKISSKSPDLVMSWFESVLHCHLTFVALLDNY